MDENNIKSIYDVNIKNLTRVYVNKVFEDGTLIVDISNPPEGLNRRERVTLLGIESQGTRGGRNNRAGSRTFPYEAYNFMKQLVEEQYVYLAFVWELRERNNNLLAYVFFESGGDLNGIFIRQGMVKMDRNYVFHFEKEFEKFENNVRIRGMGPRR